GHVTPIEWLGRGEQAGDLAYDIKGGGEEESFPKTFDMKDFDKYVKLMEDRIMQKDGKYDPNDRSYPDPVPVNERLLPDLYLGKGPDILITHTRREGIGHRLISVLLNKLCHNYYKLSQGNTIADCFIVMYNDVQCIFPEDLIQALVDTGHKVEVCHRVQLSNFGFQFCVKEDDGSFTAIPTTIMARTGIERTSDNQPVYFCAPHGGMDVWISGPLIGKERPCWLQFYVSAAGSCSFHPDHGQDAPWNAKKPLADVYSHENGIRAIRMCAMVAITFNRIATDFTLPCGGYGILGVCNDSSTLIDYALHGKTNAYPLVSTGRYLNHIVSYLIKAKDELSQNKSCQDKLEPVICDILSLIKSTSHLPSDLHISPSYMIDTYARFDVTYSLPVFQSIAYAKAILKEMADTAKEYADE
ncbi:hypothetical protein ACHAXR_004049, partial [Thalassiosira sp. AJA248-18]